MVEVRPFTGSVRGGVLVMIRDWPAPIGYYLEPGHGTEGPEGVLRYFRVEGVEKRVERKGSAKSHETE